MKSRFALLLGLLLFFSIKASAYDFEIDGLQYSKLSENTVSVVGTSLTEGELIIPEEVSYNSVNYSVTTIGDYAFEWSSGFTGSLTIPNSVTTIGDHAFSSCWGFTGSLTIGNSVTTIGNYAFSSCWGFTGSLTIGNSVTTIGNYAFSYCRGFTGSLTIGNSVTTIGHRAFYECYGFTGSLTIPNSVTTIREDAFYNCSGFTGSLTIPNSVITIGSFAFDKCSGLTSVFIGNSVSEIGRGVFRSCSGITSIDISDENLYYKVLDGVLYNKDFTTLILWPAGKSEIDFDIPESVISIGDDAFANCSRLTGSLTIHNSVTTIGSNAFSYCSGLTSVFIGDSVSRILAYAFQGCSGLTSVFIGDSVSEIGNFAFQGCSSLTSVFIGDSVSEIGQGAFASCPELTSIDISDENLYYKILDGVLYNKDFTTLILCPAGKSEIDFDIPESVISIGDFAFAYCSRLTGSLTIPNSVTSIGICAFLECFGFTGDLIIPDSVTTIGPDAFYGCTGFNGSLTIPNSVTTIGEWAFGKCSGFTGNLTIPESLSSIEYATFAYCSGFNGSLTIPNSITTIGDIAFVECSSLNCVISFATEVPELLGYSVFYGIPSEAVLYVYESVLEDYENSDWAKYFSRIIPMEDPIIEVTSIEISPEGKQEMTEGATLVFSASVLPENATDATVDWSTEDEDIIVIEVDEDNPNEVSVTALAVGEAVLTATATDGSGVFAEVKISVTESQAPVVYVTSIEISPEDEQEMTEGEELVFTATVSPKNATDATVVWSTDNEDVIAIEVSDDDSNEVTVIALAQGEAFLIAEANDGSKVSATVEITVLEPTTEPEPTPEVVDKYVIRLLYGVDGVVLRGAAISWEIEGKLSINPENSSPVSALSSSSILPYELEAEIVENELTIDLTSLPLGTYVVTVPQGYVLIGENGINAKIEFPVSVEEVSGITGINADADGYYNVYKISGEKVLYTKDASKLMDLENDIYIINGKKVMIRK